jgi:hypothetical protein
MLSIHHDCRYSQRGPSLPRTHDPEWYKFFKEKLILVPFVVTAGIIILFVTIMILIPPPFMSSILQLTYISTPFALLMIAIGFANFIISWISEKFIFVRMLALWNRLDTWRKKLSKRKQWTKTKKYLMVEESM